MDCFSSPSATRCIVKGNNCRFCERDYEGEELWIHLTETSNCRDLYARFLKTRGMGQNSVKSIMAKIYGCIHCCISRSIKLKFHLSRNVSCLEYYQNRFGIEDTSLLCTHVSRLKLMAETKHDRALRYQQHKNDKSNSISVSTVESLNNYRNSVKLANYKTCIKCKANCTEYGATEVNPEIVNVDVNSEMLYIRRLGKFWLCSYCSKDDEKESVRSGPSLTITSCTFEDRTMYYYDKDGSTGENISLSDQDVSHSISTVLFPVACNGLKDIFPDQSKIKSRSHLIRDIFASKQLTLYDLSMIYENEVSKYLKAVNSGTLYVGSYDAGAFPALSEVTKLTLDAHITCSKSWYKRQQSDMYARMDQFGILCFYISIEVPVLSIEVIATAMLTEGRVITIDNYGSSCGEFVTSYKLHVNHNSNIDCTTNCPTVDLLKYIEEHDEEISMLVSKHVPTYVSSVHQKLNSLAKHIIKVSSCGLYSEDYHLTLKFDLNGVASIEGCIWPLKLSSFNEKIAQGIDINENELTTYIDSVVAATTDLHYLMSNFQDSELETQKLIELVEENQFKNCASNIELPSLYTLMQHTPVDSRNLEVSKRMREMFLTKLIGLDLEIHHDLSTLKWLELVWEGVSQTEISDNFDSIFITVEEELYTFYIEPKFSAMINEYKDTLTAVYHFALICCDENAEMNIILKRLKIKDCYTTEFNPLLLKAAGSSIVVKPIRGINMYEKLTTVKRPPGNYSREVNSSLYLTHRELSLAEVLSLCDFRKKRVNSSTQIEKVNTRSKRPLLFRKIINADNTNSQEDIVIGPGGEYIPARSIIEKYFNRINGQELLLCETACWYDSVDCSQSKTFVSLYRDRIEEIPNSEIACIIDDQKFLPEIIMLSNGGVLKKRSIPKVLCCSRFTEFTFNYMYSKLLLFSSLQREEDIDHSNIRDMFLRRDDNGMIIVIKNER